MPRLPSTDPPPGITILELDVKAGLRFTVIAVAVLHYLIMSVHADHAAAPATRTTTTTVTTKPNFALTAIPALQGPTFAMWHHRWQGPNLGDYPTDVQSTVNMVILGVAQSTGNGAIDYSPANGQSVADHAADIRAFEAKGIRVSLGFAGGGDTTTITNDTQVANFVASVDRIRHTYGISGVDVDLEPSGSNWTEPSLVKALKQLESRYGTDFNIGITVGLYTPHTARWLDLANALGPTMDYMAPMLYDFPEAIDSRLTAVSLDKVQIMMDSGIPINKQMLGYMQRPSANYQASSPQVIREAFTEVKRRHPGIRGAFLWEDKIETAEGWSAARALGPLVRS